MYWKYKHTISHDFIYKKSKKKIIEEIVEMSYISYIVVS